MKGGELGIAGLSGTRVKNTPNQGRRSKGSLEEALVEKRKKLRKKGN